VGLNRAESTQNHIMLKLFTVRNIISIRLRFILLPSILIKATHETKKLFLQTKLF